MLPGVTQPSPPSIVDPSSIQSEPASPLAVLGVSGQIIDLTTSGKFQNASRLLALAHTISGNLEANLEIYLNLLGEANSRLNSTRSHLNETLVLVQAGNLTGAHVELNLANDELAKTNSNLDTLNLVLARISDIYDIDVTSQLTKVSGLTSLMKSYEKESSNLQSKIASADKRDATVLQLRTLENSILVNQSVVLIGSLHDAKGAPLPSREIQIVLLGTSVGLSTRTLQNGAFRAALRITPAFGLSTAMLTGKFEPTGKDQAKYRPSVSPVVTVEIRYLQAKLLVSPLSASTRVSNPFAIQGRLVDSTNSPIKGKMIGLSVDGTAIEEFATDANGRFTFEYSFPPGTVTGAHIVAVTFIPENDLFAMQTAAFQIEVSYYPTSLSADLPAGPLFSGQTIVVKGAVTSPDAVGNGTVQAFANGKLVSTVQVSSSGKFQAPVTVPFDASNVVITIAFMPVAPWLEASTVTLQIPVTNSISITLACAAMGLVGLAVYKTPRSMLALVTSRRRHQRHEADNGILAEPQAEKHAAKLEQLILDLSTLRQKSLSPSQLIKSVYRSVRVLLSLAFNVTIEPSLTHWEFLEKTRLPLKDASKYLEELTVSFERVEYAEQMIPAMEAEKMVNDSIVLTETVGGKVLN